MRDALYFEAPLDTPQVLAALGGGAPTLGSDVVPTTQGQSIDLLKAAAQPFSAYLHNYAKAPLPFFLDASEAVPADIRMLQV